MGIFNKVKTSISDAADKQKANAAIRSIEKENRQIAAGYVGALKEWEKQNSLVDTLIRAFDLASKGQDAVSTSAVMRKGEFALWSGSGSLHESKRLPGKFVGGSRGVSVPTPIKGVRLRAGAIKGSYIPGPEVQQQIDIGVVILTTSRVIFNGRLKTQEWAFSKWTGAEASSDETSYMFHVSNRQKASGVNISSEFATEFNRFLAQAIDTQREEVEGVLVQLKQAKMNIVNAKPAKPELRELPESAE